MLNYSFGAIGVIIFFAGLSLVATWRKCDLRAVDILAQDSLAPARQDLELFEKGWMLSGHAMQWHIPHTASCLARIVRALGVAPVAIMQTPIGADAGVSCMLIAHRGGVIEEERIENNIPAIEEAIARGYYMIEVDIRESKDGHLIVHHDADFRRFYADDRQVVNLTWDEIKMLRSNPGNLRPMDFGEFARLCKGRIRLMLDTKGSDHSRAFFEEMERILRENDLLRSAFVIGTEQSKDFFLGKAKLGVSYQQLLNAVAAGEQVSDCYFLFEHGDVTDEAVRFAQRHRVAVVPSVNVFHYPTAEHQALAARDLKRLKALGVRYFQIDSVYDEHLMDDDEPQ